MNYRVNVYNNQNIFKANCLNNLTRGFESFDELQAYADKIKENLEVKLILAYQGKSIVYNWTRPMQTESLSA